MTNQHINSDDESLAKLRAVIREELASESTQRLERDDQGGSKLSRTSRHPLTAIFVSFALTAVVGSALSYFYSIRQAERERDAIQMAATRESRAVQLEKRLEAIRGFSKLVYGRHTRGTMLEAALHRRANTDELKERKRLYDESFLAWGENLQSNMLMIRQAMGSVRYSSFEGHVQNSFTPIVRSYDFCVTKAYDTALRGENPEIAFTKCRIRVLRKAFLDCSYAITSGLYILVMSEETGDIQEQEAARVLVEENIPKGCSVPGVK